MVTGPCKHCGLPVVIDDSVFLAEWEGAIQGKSPSEIEAMQSFTTTVMNKFAPHVNHSHCIERFREEAGIRKRIKLRNERQARYSKAFPFRAETRFDEIPFKDKAAVMTEFHVNRESVTLIGESGRGKTRLAWALLEPPFLEGAEVRVFTHAKLKSALHTATGKGASAVAALVDALCKVDILLLDDLGKADMARGESGLQIEEATFQILDARIGMKSVRTILTTNDVGETLVARMTPDRGRPLVRRIQELTKLFAG